MENKNEIAQKFGLSVPTITKMIKNKILIRSQHHYTLNNAPSGEFVSLRKACQMTHYSKEGLKFKRQHQEIKSYKVNEHFYLYDVSSIKKRNKHPKNLDQLRVAEAAYLLKIKENKIRYYAKKGLIPYIKDQNGHRRFKITDLKLFFENTE